jgi:hypothetical protein
MKIRTRFPESIAAVLLGALAGAHPAGAADVIEGVLSQVTDTSVTMDSARTFRFDPATAECFDFRNDRTTCATLVAIGYADKVRLTLVGDTVQRIDILLLQQ